MDINASQMSVKTQINEQKNSTQSQNTGESFSKELKEMQKASETETNKVSEKEKPTEQKAETNKTSETETRKVSEKETQKVSEEGVSKEQETETKKNPETKLFKASKTETQKTDVVNTSPKTESETKNKFEAEIQNNTKNGPNEQNIKNTQGDIKTKNIENAFDDLNSIVKEVNNKNDIHQLNEKFPVQVKKNDIIDDTDKKEDVDLINNNDCNIKENQDAIRKMDLNMNFSGNGQEFSSFMNNKDAENKINATLGNSKKELEEEAAILSTMEENIEIANKNNILKSQQKTDIQKDNKTDLQKDEPVKEKENVQNKNNSYIRSDIVIEKVVNSDNLFMTKEDVDVFIDIVNGKDVNLNNLTSEKAEKAVNVSRTLIDMLAKIRENNQSLRIDFDNDISIIIKISREGKLSADFLPSSQIAETYLKENLPLLRQRFEENDIPYDELNQKERRNKDNENNRRKDKKDE